MNNIQTYVLALQEQENHEVDDMKKRNSGSFVSFEHNPITSARSM